MVIQFCPAIIYPWMSFFMDVASFRIDTESVTSRSFLTPLSRSHPPGFHPDCSIEPLGHATTSVLSSCHLPLKHLMVDTPSSLKSSFLLGRKPFSGFPPPWAPLKFSLLVPTLLVSKCSRSSGSTERSLLRILFLDDLTYSCFEVPPP